MICRIDIEWSRGQFNIAANLAKEAFKRGKYCTAATWVQIAADYAARRHLGFFASPELEMLLLSIAKCIHKNDQNHFTTKLHSNKQRVLHVMTKAIPSGGHSRAVERWIRNSKEAVHDLVITCDQQTTPGWLVDAIQDSGGSYRSLAVSNGNIIQRAIDLREISQHIADVIILHAHMYDVVPLIAFGISGGAPVVYFNHADHRFWLGSSIADVVADIRIVGNRITSNRRGVRNSVILPIPLTDTYNGISKEDARKRLGIGSNTTVLLSVGAQYKYAPFGEHDFVETAVNILLKYPEAILIAIGPVNDSRWSEASKATGGRISALGTVYDLELYHKCADIYLDSFPLSSFTAFLEVGLHNVPVISFKNTEAPLFTDCRIDQESPFLYPESIDEYMSLVGELICDRNKRIEKGIEIGCYIRNRHLLPKWTTYLSKIYNVLPKEHMINNLDKISEMIDANDIYMASFYNRFASHYTICDSIMRHSRYLPLNDRVKLLIDGVQKKNGIALLPLKSYASDRVLSVLKKMKAILNKVN